MPGTASAHIPSRPSRALRLPAVHASTATFDRLLFWAFIVGLAWLPFWYGSNDLVAWGINAVLFCALAGFYEVALLIRGRGHPVGLGRLALPAVLFAAVAVWIWAQTVCWPVAPLQHPAWPLVSAALGQAPRGSVSVNRDATELGLMRLVTAAATFWIAVQLCRDGSRAVGLLRGLVVTGCGYAAYAFLAHALDAAHRSGAAASDLPLSAPFINHNSLATYAGLTLIAAVGLIAQRYRSVRSAAAPNRYRLAEILEATGRGGGALVAAAILLAAAVLLTGSRGGVIAAALGLAGMGLLRCRRSRPQSAGRTGAFMLAACFGCAVMLAYSDLFIGQVAERGLNDADRLSVAVMTVRSVLDAPFTGHGYATFADIFPLYRDRSIAVQGVWEQAHDTYLEVFQGLGLVFGTMLIVSIATLVLRCAVGAVRRRRNAIVPCVAASSGILVGTHALVDFSLQIQAVTLTFMAILGAGVAQSVSSRQSISD